MELHIGKQIKTIFDKSNLTMVEFAKQIGTTRENAYAIFKRESIDLQMLMKIGAILNYNFFDWLSNQISIAQGLSEKETKCQEQVKILHRENLLLQDIIRLLKDKYENK